MPIRYYVSYYSSIIVIGAPESPEKVLISYKMRF
jgi:hypothetical protein